MSALSKWTADLLLERVIQALAISDVSELEQLVQIAEEIRAQGVELAFNESGMRLLLDMLIHALVLARVSLPRQMLARESDRVAFEMLAEIAIGKYDAKPVGKRVDITDLDDESGFTIVHDFRNTARARRSASAGLFAQVRQRVGPAVRSRRIPTSSAPEAH